MSAHPQILFDQPQVQAQVKFCLVSTCWHVCWVPSRIFYFCFLEGHLRWPDNGDKEALWAPVPICTPEGGALMGWVGHPAHMGTPTGCPLQVAIYFSFIWSLVHSPSARSRLQWAPIGCPYVHPYGVHIINVCALKDVTRRVIIPSGLILAKIIVILAIICGSTFLLFAATLRGPLIPFGDMPSAFLKLKSL